MKKPLNYLNAEEQIFNKIVIPHIAEINVVWGGVIR
jgi:hypothetical protein